jgi:hypothetical protein
MRCAKPASSRRSPKGSAKIAVLHIVGSSVASLDEVKTIADDVAGLQLFVVSNPVSDAPISKEALRGFTVIDFPKLNDHTYQMRSGFASGD